MATEITIQDFTTEDLAGTGAFDVMMRGLKGHLVAEFQAGRIKGPEYATVYLGSLQSTMDRALEFLMGKDKLTLELAILEIEKQKAEIEKDKALAEKQLIEAQVQKIGVEIELAELEKDKIAADSEGDIPVYQRDIFRGACGAEKNKCAKTYIYEFIHIKYFN